MEKELEGQGIRFTISRINGFFSFLSSLDSQSSSITIPKII